MTPSNPRKRVHPQSPSRFVRRKLSPSPETSDEPSISEASALIPTSHSSGSTVVSSPASSLSSDSELSESSEDPSSESADSDSEDESEEASEEDLSEEDEDEIVVIGADGRKRKPKIKAGVLGRAESLTERLKDFLPKLKAANEELEVDIKKGKVKDRLLELEGEGEGEEEEDGKQYIEMNLGLGVLEEKDPNAGSESESEEEISGDEEGESGQRNGKDIMAKLMGQERPKEGAGIQVVEDK